MNISVDFTNSEHIKLFNLNAKNKSQHYLDLGFTSMIYNFETGKIVTAIINAELIAEDTCLPITDIEFVKNVIPNKSSAAYIIPGLNNVETSTK